MSTASSQGYNADKKAKARREAPITIGGVEFRQRSHTNGLQRAQSTLARQQMKLNRIAREKVEQAATAAIADDHDKADELSGEADDLDAQAIDLTYEIIATSIKPGRVSHTHIAETAQERAHEAARAEAEGNESREQALAKEKLPEISKEVERELSTLADAAKDEEGNVKLSFLVENLEIPEATELMAFLNGVNLDDAEEDDADEDPTQGT